MKRYIFVLIVLIAINIDICAKVNLSGKMEDVQTLMRFLGTTNVLDCISCDIMNGVHEKSNESSAYRDIINEFMKLAVVDNDKDIVTFIPSDECQSRIIHQYERALEAQSMTESEYENVAVLLGTVFSEYDELNKKGIRFGSGYFNTYCYQPLKDGLMPLHSDKWERLILARLVELQKERHNVFLQRGNAVSASGQEIKGLLWLARYGKTEDAKIFLVEMPFYKDGTIYSWEKSKFSYMRPANDKDPFAVEKGDYSGWIDWYLKEVIEPAGLAHRFMEQVEDMNNYVETFKGTSPVIK